MTFKELEAIGKERLLASGIADYETDAMILFEQVTGIGRGELMVRGEENVSEREADQYTLFLEKRISHIPTQYITGRADFMGLEFIVDRNVLIPRFDTEYLVEEMMREVGDGSSVLDMCTGSGCILLSLMRYKNGINGTGADISGAAIDIAKKNESAIFNTSNVKSSDKDDLHNWKNHKNADLNNMHKPVHWIISDMFENIDGRFDHIVSNPPYIRSDVIGTLMPEVREYEPEIALDGDEDGLRYYRVLASQAGDHLRRGGKLFLEIGYDQGREVSELLISNGYKDISVKKDYSGNDRVVTGTI